MDYFSQFPFSLRQNNFVLAGISHKRGLSKGELGGHKGRVMFKSLLDQTHQSMFLLLPLILQFSFHYLSVPTRFFSRGICAILQVSYY